MQRQFTFSRFTITGLLLTPLTTFACMPHSPDDVFIARFQSAQHLAMTNEYHLTWKHPKFIFRDFRAWFRYSKPKQWHSHFQNGTRHSIKPFQTIQKNDLIIGLAYTMDGNQPHHYSVVSFSQLKCQNNQISIGQPIASFTAWNRKNKRCQHDHPESVALLDGFFDYDQQYYLKKLSQKYPTCQALFAAFPKS